MNRSCWIVASALFLWTCGGTEPTAVPTGATTLRLVSGETGAPVPAADLWLSTTHHRADSNGEITLLGAPEWVPAGEISIEASGFLPRRTVLRPGGREFTLWPKTSPTGLTETSTRDLVYRRQWISRSLDFPLVRLAPSIRRVSIVVASRQLRSLPAAMDGFASAADVLTEIAAGEILFTADAEPAPGAALVTVVWDPEDPCGTCAYLDMRWDEIVGAKLVFRTRLGDGYPGQWSWMALHELGHVYGLGHIIVEKGSGDVMAGYSDQPYTPRERLVMRLMRQRPPGNNFPDDDRDARASASRAGVRTVVIPCAGLLR